MGNEAPDGHRGGTRVGGASFYWRRRRGAKRAGTQIHSNGGGGRGVAMAAGWARGNRGERAGKLGGGREKTRGKTGKNPEGSRAEPGGTGRDLRGTGEELK